MKLQERLKKEYRLLALAVVFFAAGAIFFWYDASLPSHAPTSTGTPSSPAVSVQPPNSGASQSGQQLDPDFSKFPPPAQFGTFTYGRGGFNGSSSTLLASSTCNASYIAVLIFPSAVDYRSDIESAVYNDAFPCTAGRPFALSITTSDIATAPFGNYYLIIADQQKTGAWYNPR